MVVTKTHIDGCLIMEPELYEDERGHFAETYNQQRYDQVLGTNVRFVQDNQSLSKKGVIRALHFQLGVHAQAKLVRVLHGKVLDVAVDIRKNSPTFGQHVAVELSESNRKQLYIPRGFAHGFATLSESAVFFYKCDNFYNKDAESGIRFDDPVININWGIPGDQIVVSEKDLALAYLERARL